MRTRGSPDAEHDAHRDEPDHRVPSVEGTDEDDARRFVQEFVVEDGAR